MLNSDHVALFTSDEYVSFVKGLEMVRVSMDGNGWAKDNAIVKRFFRTIQCEKLYIEVPETAAAAFRMCMEFIAYYNYMRDHCALGKRPPMSVYTQVT